MKIGEYTITRIDISAGSYWDSASKGVSEEYPNGFKQFWPMFIIVEGYIDYEQQQEDGSYKPARELFRADLSESYHLAWSIFLDFQARHEDLAPLIREILGSPRPRRPS